jgi:hypothetical protein
VALLLQKRGITRIHPLAGGIDSWLENKFPLETAALLNPLTSAAGVPTAEMSGGETVKGEIV